MLRLPVYRDSRGERWFPLLRTKARALGRADSRVYQLPEAPLSPEVAAPPPVLPFVASRAMAFRYQSVRWSHTLMIGNAMRWTPRIAQPAVTPKSGIGNSVQNGVMKT